MVKFHPSMGQDGNRGRTAFSEDNERMIDRQEAGEKTEQTSICAQIRCRSICVFAVVLQEADGEAETLWQRDNGTQSS